MEVTGILNAFISPSSSISPKHLTDPACLEMVTYWDLGSTCPVNNGFTLVGTARITLTLLDSDTITTNKISALKEEAKTIRAEATAKVTRIEGKIQQLLCIENSAGAK